MESSAIVDEEDLIEIKIQGNDAASRKTFNVSKVLIAIYFFTGFYELLTGLTAVVQV